MNVEKIISKVRKLSSEYSSEVDCIGNATDEDISKAESLLKIEFPPSFKLFLKNFGALSFGSEEFYGVIPGEVPSDCVPCVLFLTMRARERGDISESMIKIKSSGYGPVFSIDMSDVDEYGEGKVVETTTSYKDTKERKVVANNFAEFLYDEVLLAIEDIEE